MTARLRTFYSQMVVEEHTNLGPPGAVPDFGTNNSETSAKIGLF